MTEPLGLLARADKCPQQSKPLDEHMMTRLSTMDMTQMAIEQMMLKWNSMSGRNH